MPGRNPPSLRDPAFRRELLLVALVAVGIRILHLAFFRHSPFFSAPILDSAFHDRLARSLAAGDWAAGAPYFRPPLFPWLLGLAYAVAGAGPWPGRILNALAGTATALAVLWTGARLGLGRGARVGAALAAALYAPGLFFEEELVAAPLAAALGAWGLFWCVEAWKRSGEENRRPRSTLAPWFWAGFFWSLAALARAPLALLPAGAAALALSAPGPRVRRLAAVMVAPVLLWTGPAAIMAAHGAGFRFPATQGGINFYAGNHPGADGRGVSVPAMEPTGGWTDFADASVRTASRRSGRALGPAGASGWWFRRGLAFWKEEPGAALRLTAAKALYLLHGFETPNNRSLYAARRDVPWLTALLWRLPGAYWPTGLLLSLAAAGAWTVRWRRRWLPVLLYAAVTLVPLVFFFTASRFRLPALPAFVLLAAAPWAEFARGSRPAVLVFAVFYVAGNAPWPGAVRTDSARENLARAEASLNTGRLSEARAAYQRVLHEDPTEGRACLGLAVLAEEEGRPAEALEWIRRAAPHLPASWELENAWARILERAGRTAAALPHRERAVRLFPENGDLRARLGLTLETLGQDRAAAEALEQAAARGCTLPEAWNSLGRYRLAAGDEAGSRAAWDRALALAPGAFKALYNRGLLNAREGRRAGAEADLRAARAAAPDSAAAARAETALEWVRFHLP